VAILFLALLAAAGLVVDGGTKIRAARQASSIAEEAARAGAGRIDQNRAYTRGGRFVVDRAAAAAAARAYLADSGNNGTVSVINGQKIRVTVTVSKPTTLLSLIGIGNISVTKTATADLLQGIDQAQ
jgi:Flp pilus assembly protein TadG